MFKAAILLDKENNWIKNYFPKVLTKRKDIKINLFYHPKKIRKYDIVFLLGYTKILKDDFLNSNNLVLVVHESNLPKGKGFAPIQWQILEGKNKITFSLIEAASKFDSGDIIDQEELTLSGLELYDEIRFKQAKITFRLIKRFLKKYPKYDKTKQTGESSFYRKRNAKDSELDINLSIKNLFPLLRVVNNEKWPAFFKINGSKYILKIYKKERQ